MKKIIYVYRRHAGGTYIMLYESFIVLHSMGISSSVLHVSEKIDQVKDSVLFFLKNQPDKSLIDKLKNNNNTIILIPGDGNVSEIISYFKTSINIDGVIVASDVYKRKLESLGKSFTVKVIPHNYDYFINSDMFKAERDEKFRLYFGGSVSTSGLTQGDLGLRQYSDYHEGYFMPLHYALKDSSINNSNFTSEDRHKIVLDSKSNPEVFSHVLSDANPSKYSCHYAVRCPKVADTSSHWIAKSATKLVTAAGSESNIITSLDPPVRVLIDESYPYSIDTETDEFLDDPDRACMDMIEYAKSTYKTKVWYDALGMMREVKNRTSTENVTKEYLSFVEEIV